MWTWGFRQYYRKRVTIGADTKSRNAYGGDGNDTLIGNALDNILYGGVGITRLMGNARSDVFKIKQNAGQADVNTDFDLGNPLEKIDLGF
ncbi:MAG: M10 family metallopeptidase C-terminal domain-containing protein [Elusimicrobia bacterium]|nr:M10 family metallopeptidase C-terminal domain-containing protein [Elusimicrobiota bacterium]